MRRRSGSKRHRTAKKRTCKTGKTRYRDDQEAKRALSKIRKRSKRDRIPSRYYACHLCKGFHLTSEK